MNGQQRVPQAFISYSHSDRTAAEAIAVGLQAAGVASFFDKWEIKPGDSLIQKIFEEGLKDCDVFIILLSPASVESAWVKSELDAAIVRRIEGNTRVCPVIVAACQIPVSLRALMWLDCTKIGTDGVVHALADVAFGRSAKPPLGVPRDHNFPSPVRGLSRDASAVAAMLVGAWTQQGASSYTPESVAEFYSLTPEQTNDAADELESLGLVRLHRYIGTAPFNFGAIEPTYVLPLFLHESGSQLSYDPSDDILQIANAVAAHRAIDGTYLDGLLHIPAWRMNNAVDFLEDRGVVEVLRALGTAPYGFMSLQATAATRRFVASRSK